MLRTGRSWLFSLTADLVFQVNSSVVTKEIGPSPARALNSDELAVYDLRSVGRR